MSIEEVMWTFKQVCLFILETFVSNINIIVSFIKKLLHTITSFDLLFKADMEYNLY